MSLYLIYIKLMCKKTDFNWNMTTTMSTATSENAMIRFDITSFSFTIQIVPFLKLKVHQFLSRVANCGRKVFCWLKYSSFISEIWVFIVNEKTYFVIVSLNVFSALFFVNMKPTWEHPLLIHVLSIKLVNG